MQNITVLEKVETLAAQAAERHSCVVYDLEFAGGGGNRVLRIYIDKPSDAEGVSINDCSMVSQSLNLLLDVEDPIPGGAYSLEVSSPGLERKLKRKEHFISAVGESVLIRCQKAFAEIQPNLREHFGLRKQAELALLSVEEDSLVLSDGQVELRVPLEEVEKAHVVFVFEESPETLQRAKKASKTKKSRSGKGKR